MTTKTRDRSDFLPGFVILVLLAILLLCTSVIAYFRSNPIGMRGYELQFTLGMGIQGLENGSPIYFGGIDVGQVNGLHYNQGNLVVHMEIDRSVRLYPGANISRSASLIGGQASLVIHDVGSTETGPLDGGSKIQASSGPGGVANLIGTENANRLTEIQDSLTNAVTALEAVRTEASRISGEAKELTVFAEAVEQDFETWQPHIERIEAKIDSIQEKGRLIKESQQGPEEGNAPRQSTLSSSWAKIIEQANDLRDSFEKEVRPKLDRLIAAAEQDWEDLQSIMDRLQGLAGDARTSLNEFMANSTLAGEQLSLAESEILGALGLPLLERPSQQDIELLMREQAIGDWTRAAIELRESLEAMQTVSIPEGDDAQATLARLVDTLRAALADYEDAQGRFLSLPPLHDVEEK